MTCKFVKRSIFLRVYLWRIHVDIWQNQYNIVKLKNKIIIDIKKKKNKPFPCLSLRLLAVDKAQETFYLSS